MDMNSVVDDVLENIEKSDNANRPSRKEAEAAVRTLISWAGDDPAREGLIETPKRVVKAYEEFFAGYDRSEERRVGKEGGRLRSE